MKYSHNMVTSSSVFLVFRLCRNNTLTSSIWLKSDLFFNGYRRQIEREYAVNIPYDIMRTCETYYAGICKGSMMAQENNGLFYQVSAKTGLNVQTAFRAITAKAYQYQLDQSDNKKPVLYIY